MTTDTAKRSGRDGDRDGDQPLPTEGTGDVLASLIEKIKARRAIGLERYGRPLQEFNGRDPFQDHEEELIDKHNYAEQIQREYRALWEAVRVLGRKVRGEAVPVDNVESALDLARHIEGVEAKKRPLRPSVADVAAAVEAQMGGQ